MFNIDFQVRQNIDTANAELEMLQRLKKIQRTEILVGIPESEAARKDGEMNNPTLLYIHTKGSPLRNLPARPVIEPALEDEMNAARIIDDLRKVVDLVFANKFDQARKQMEITGKDAANMIRMWFVDPKNNWEPNARATVLRKLKKLSKKKRTEMIADYDAGNERIDKPLIDTGELRKAITYVVKEK